MLSAYDYCIIEVPALQTGSIYFIATFDFIGVFAAGATLNMHSRRVPSVSCFFYAAASCAP